MRNFPVHLRRAATQLLIQQALTATAGLSIARQRRTVHALVALADSIPLLRQRLRQNMRLALGPDIPALSASLYFRRVAWFLGNALSTFHRGVGSTPVPDEVKFDDTVAVLDEAVLGGRGVVVASPHWTGHELVAAVVNRRHPMVLLVRQAPTAERMARKLKWYNAIGTEIVLRPTHASTIKDAAVYLNVLKRGKVLCITPDLLADVDQGVEARIFGRTARFHGGAFALGVAARAPVLRPCFVWQSDTSVVVRWERAAGAPAGADRSAAIRAGVQDWCRWFEEALRANPENWLFWLDRRWSRFLRAPARASDAA
jgi:lauroyl/myristoyl acyltransferase